MDTSFHFRLKCLIVLSTLIICNNSLFAQNSCEELIVRAIANDQIEVTGIVEGEPYAIYTYDSEAASYTSHCVKDCKNVEQITPQDSDDQLFIYYNGLFCTARSIELLRATINDCIVNIKNDFCKAIDVYDKASNRFVASLDGKSHPFSPPPFRVGEDINDVVTLSENEVKDYYIFNKGKNIDNALPLETMTASCPNATDLIFSSGCSDAVGQNIFTNIGCNVLSLFTSRGLSDTVFPGEAIHIDGDGFGFETYRFSVGDSIVLEGRVFIQGGLNLEIDSGGTRDTDGNCIDHMPPTEIDCNNISITQSGTQITFTGLDGSPTTQAYIYNFTIGRYEYHCYGDCPGMVTADILSITDSYLLGVSYYDEDGILECFVTESIN